MKVDWIASSTVEKRVEEKGTEEGLSTAAEVPEAELSEEEDLPEINHAYIYAEEETQVYLRRPNLCPETSEQISIRFEKSA